MKRFTFSFLLFLAMSTFSLGQTTSGTVVVGADFPRFFSGLSRSGMKANVGFFIADNFLFGINSGIRSRTLRNLAGRSFRGPAFDLGIFARYYIPDGGSDFRVFLHGEGGIDRTWAGDLEERYEFVGAGGGVAYFVNTKLAFEAHAILQANNQDNELNINWPRWGLGIRYFIGK